MNRNTRAIITAIVSLAAAATMPIEPGRALAARAAIEPPPASTSSISRGGARDGCPILIFPDGPVAVSPNQPAVPYQSTVGIINALCDVTLDFVGCGFTPTAITIGCDTNGDGVSDVPIALKDIRVINGFLLQATIPALATTPGSAFPLVCCGGQATITLSRTITEGDDNIFGPFTQTLVCSIDLGLRAPVVISATPSEGDCTIGQNLLIPGTCFVLANGQPNVTSVFGVEVGNPNNVIHASAIQILSANLVDAFFQIGSANAGKTFLIYASGPNGTSRNLTELPPGAPAGCTLGNEQGVKVSFKCKSSSTGGSGDTASAAVVGRCQLDRDDAGTYTLSIFGSGIREGAKATVGGVSPKKLKFKGFDPADNTFTRLVAKGKFCNGLPGEIVITNLDGTSSAPLFCGERCSEQ